MRHGLMLHTRSGPAEAVEGALAAEEAGFHSLYVGERHFNATAAGFANAFAVAAAISGRLQRMCIGVIPAIGMEHPLRLVEQANMLGVLTHGTSRVVLSDKPEPRQYAAFGLPVPCNGQFEDLLQHVQEAWSWDYQEDGPPLEFSSAAFTTRMAGRIMPAGCPRLALETDGDPGIRDAARWGWAVHLRVTDLARTRHLIETYRAVLTSSSHSVSTVEDCLDGLAVVVGKQFAPSRAELESLGAAEVRFDVPLTEAIRMLH